MNDHHTLSSHGHKTQGCRASGGREGRGWGGEEGGGGGGGGVGGWGGGFWRRGRWWMDGFFEVRGGTTYVSRRGGVEIPHQTGPILRHIYISLYIYYMYSPRQVMRMRMVTMMMMALWWVSGTWDGGGRGYSGSSVFGVLRVVCCELFFSSSSPSFFLSHSWPRVLGRVGR